MKVLLISANTEQINMPEQVHLIIATRSDPPLPLLARLRSQDHLTELRSIDYAKQALEYLPLKDSIWHSVAATALGFGYGLAG